MAASLVQLGTYPCRARTRRSIRAKLLPGLPKAASTDELWNEINVLTNQSNLKALKEWSLTLQALSTGRQQVLLRKGGIREPTFKPCSDVFPLFPTGFHTDVDLLKPGTADVYWSNAQWDPKSAEAIPIKSVAQVAYAFSTEDPGVLKALDEFHIWGEGFAEKRLRWRAQQPITVMLLRVWNFETPLLVEQSDDLWGCFSWGPPRTVVHGAIHVAAKMLNANGASRNTEDVKISRFLEVMEALDAEALPEISASSQP